ncbi:hypothetical protein EKN07_09865 [Actinobaculum sp. 352]|nr:hypothetical protein EKN07_09865 [Actinobaculum sp. 352]
MDGTVVGGWSEDGGYFSDPSATAVSEEIMPAAATGTPRHTGKAEYTIINGTSHKRAHGWTTWTGVLHYTHARLEHYWPHSGVIASSGRRWGKGGTEAYTRWVAYNPNKPSNGNGKARTYYGK